MAGLNLRNSCRLRNELVIPQSAPRVLARPVGVQLSLFPDIVRSAHLVAPNSPKRAFYRIWIEANAGFLAVRKESGIRGRVLDRRRWPVDTLDQAIKMFERVIKAKTNPQRKSPRKYRLINSAQNA